mgnify:CR=1 FL=1
MLRHRLNAVHASAEVDAIQVELENLILAKAYSIRASDDRLFRFSRERRMRSREERSCQLLGQGAAALGQRSAAHVADSSTRQPDEVDAGMGIEPAILNCDNGMPKIRSDLVRVGRLAAVHRAGTTASSRRRRRLCRQLLSKGG